jgi:hypothetical protein
VRTFVALYLLALIVRAAMVGLYPDAAYNDAYYYADVARALAAGHGFNVDFVWVFAEVGNHIPANPTLPVPSNAHWLPLSSVLQAPFLMLFGPVGWASAIPMVLIGSLTAPLTLVIARDAGMSRTVGIGAAILAAVPAMGTVFMPQPENFAILQPLVAATILCVVKGLKGDPRFYALAGVLVGFASLARNDGFVLGATVGLTFIIDRARALWSRGARPPRLPLWSGFACFGLYLLVMSPWWTRQLATFGSISPTASSGAALWLRNMAEWNSITANPNPAQFFAQGWPAILESRFLGLVAAIGNFAVIDGSVVLVPLIVAGAWIYRRRVEFQPWILQAFLVFAAATIIYPVHVPGGAFIHSAIGLESHAYILALAAIEAIVIAIARRRPAWNPKQAVPLFVGAAVFFVVLTAPVYALAVVRTWRDSAEPRLKLAGEMDSLGVKPDDRLLTIDAAGFKYWTGRPGVVTPDDPIETIEAVARAYQTRWMILERGDIATALGPVLAGQQKLPWVGIPVYVFPAGDGGVPRLAMFPVCVTPGDDRCAGPPILAAR